MRSEVKMSKLELLRYAKSGVLDAIGNHPWPKQYPEEISEYKDHLRQIQKMIKKEEELADFSKDMSGMYEGDD